MNTSDLLRIRLHNQLLSIHNLKEPQEIVSYMGAMQSQSLDLAKWAIGVRLENKTVKDIDEALNTGKVIRTHILRPTWHFVSAEDIYWMFDLSNPRLKPIYQSYRRMSRGDESLILRAVSLIEKILSDGKHLTKESIGSELQMHNLKLDNTSLGLAINYAEMEGLVVNGEVRGKQQTFALLEELAPRKETISKEEALERLARRFFTGHAPATIQDFAWWSGLSLTECKQALKMIKHDFVCETINDRDFWMKNDIKIPLTDKDSVLLLPPFDEFVVCYKNRSELIGDDHYGKVMTKNGLFSPTVMLNGEIIGSWKKTVKKGMAKVDLSFFEKTPKKVQDLFLPEIERVESFYTI